LIRGGEAVPFTAHASPPTVTMPRVKAMTSGSVPSFVDAILNFAEGDESSSLAGQDTWLAQVRAGRDGRGAGRLVMFGDDTWLKLFPDMFVRADGTSSFFVSVSAGVGICRMQLSDCSLGLYRGRPQCDAQRPPRAQGRRLGRHDPALSRPRPHWPQGGADEVSLVQPWRIV
jgi:hypothetical protein